MTALGSHHEDNVTPTLTRRRSINHQTSATMGKFLEQVMKPGSPAFVVLLNCVLGMLFAVMLTVVYTELENSMHMFVMLFIIIGLTVSINWFIIEANNLKKMQLAGESNESKQDTAKTTRAKTD